jgi:hypothetical protein
MGNNTTRTINCTYRIAAIILQNQILNYVLGYHTM